MFGLNRNFFPVKEPLRLFIRDVATLVVFSSGKIKKNARPLFFSFLFKALSFPLGLSVIYAAKYALDKGLMASDAKLFLWMTLLGLAAFAVSRWLGYAGTVLISKVKAVFAGDMNREFASRFFGLDYLKAKELSSAENAFILDYDYRNIEDLIFQEMPSMASFVKIPVFFVLAFLLSKPLAAMLLLAFPFMVLQTAWASGRHEVFRTKEFRRSNRYAMILSDMLVNLKLVKSMNKESWALEKVNAAFREKAAGGLATSLFFSKMHFMGDLFSKIFAAVFTIAGGLMIIKGGLTLGTFSAVSMYAILMVSEASHVSFFIEEIIAERPSLKRSARFIREVTEVTAVPAPDKGTSGKTLSGDIEYRNVTFGYRSDHILFKDLSFVVPRGSWALVKGPSGSGKTTLICLFLKLLRPGEGSIHLGGEDIWRIPNSPFFKGISVVHQEPYLFNDSLISNILLGDEKKRECCEKAFSAAGVDELAGGMLLGYNTRVGEMGLSLSGGQKQRIAIARALARDPEILILDEATSSLDPASEESVLRNIKTLYPGITVVFVTHRESVLKYADRVFVLSEGRMNMEDKVHAA